jgi:hypothetical protein
MATKRKALQLILPVVSLFLLGISSAGMISPLQEADAQNATTATNQTGTTTANQTAGGAQNQSGIFTNITNSDFGPIREDIALARDSIHDNDNVEAYRGLGWADNEIFILANEEENQADAILAKLKPLQDSIQSAQESIQQGNNATALNEIGSAEVALLEVTQQLPTNQTEESEVEDTEDTDAPEGGG